MATPFQFTLRRMLEAVFWLAFGMAVVLSIGSDPLLSNTDFLRITLSTASFGFALGCIAGKRGHWALAGLVVGCLASGELTQVREFWRSAKGLSAV